MIGNSRPVHSSQEGVHLSLEAVISRHLSSCWRKPVAVHNQLVFQHLQQWRAQQGGNRAMILDSGCGTGRAARVLAGRYPDALVIGVDQSAARLQRGNERFGKLPDNLQLVRAECADIWRLMLEACWRINRHFLLYPNPWPKPGHLQRRWHGHPVFPQLLTLSMALELRTNWPVYAEEMAAALALAGRAASLQRFVPEQPISDFEEKYRASGHTLIRLTTSQD